MVKGHCYQNLVTDPDDATMSSEPVQDDRNGETTSEPVQENRRCQQAMVGPSFFFYCISWQNPW